MPWRCAFPGALLATVSVFLYIFHMDSVVQVKDRTRRGMGLVALERSGYLSIIFVEPNDVVRVANFDVRSADGNDRSLRSDS